MTKLIHKIPAAVKHGGYSAIGVLPGEDQAAFTRLRRKLIAEFTPCGELENDIVEEMTRLVWRKQNLKTQRVARRAQNYLTKILEDKLSIEFPGQTNTHPDSARIIRTAEDQARTELGDTYHLVEVGEAASFEGLAAELDIEDRINRMIERCLKRLLYVRGLKSLPTTTAFAPTPRLAAPSKVP
jgi:hypothetical protein